VPMPSETEMDRVTRAAQNRAPRETETRATETRPAPWAPPDLLPAPTPQEGYVHRWVRIRTLGEADPTNESKQRREGWEFCRPEDHPELMLSVDPGSRSSGRVEIGGLVLCKIARETIQQRADYYAQLTARQMESVDQNFMRENDRRMPLFRERSSTTSFGRGMPR
jgi:hypothetical protein